MPHRQIIGQVAAKPLIPLHFSAAARTTIRIGRPAFALLRTIPVSLFGLVVEQYLVRGKRQVNPGIGQRSLDLGQHLIRAGNHLHLRCAFYPPADTQVIGVVPKLGQDNGRLRIFHHGLTLLQAIQNDLSCIINIITAANTHIRLQPPP